MGMSTHVIGIKPPDKKWKAMKAAWDACTNAGVAIPDEVGEFFGHETPDEKGVIVEIEESQSCAEWHDESASGFEINISKLPPDVKMIRFYNSW